MKYVKLDGDLVVGFGDCDPKYLPANAKEVRVLPELRDGYKTYLRGNKFEYVRGLEDVKADKWKQIKQARNIEEFGGFEWDGSRFDSNAISQQRIAGAAQMAAINPAFTVDWTLADNTVRELDAQEMISVGVALSGHVAAAHAKARDLRQQIEAAQTEEEVEAVVW